MKTTIKIHDTEWFNEHCKSCNQFNRLMPKYDSWSHARTIHWILSMHPLEGKVLEVERDCGNKAKKMIKTFCMFINSKRMNSLQQES